MQCPYCGAVREKTAVRNGLVLHTDPLRVNFRGSRLRLTRRQAEIMEMLIKFGRASFEVLEGDRSRNALRAIVDQLRLRLPPGVRINLVRGWGYELEVARPGAIAG